MTNNTPDYGPMRVTAEWPIPNGWWDGETVDANDAAAWLERRFGKTPRAAREAVARADRDGETFILVGSVRVHLSVQW